MTGIVLGSGLGPLADAVEVQKEVSFAEAGLPPSSVPGHAGHFIVGTLGGREVILMNGRVHLYEGHSGNDVTAGIRWMAQQGIKRLVLTNAAGSLHPDFEPGSWMMFSDHINLTGTSPLSGPQFIDMSTTYDKAWRDDFRTTAIREGAILHEGVYAGLRGPQYETPAEVRMLRTMGADAVGMSTVLEAIEACSLGLTVAAFSCLTNWAAGISHVPLNHDEVIETGRRASASMVRMLTAVLSHGE